MIDWKFIGELEGSRLAGYVPDAAHSHSGVTVASGVDVGQMTHADLTGFTPALMQKLLPYVGLKGQAAVDALHAHPLTVTPAEAESLDQHARREALYDLQVHFLHSSGRTLDSIPQGAQTVLASLTFQYGSPWHRTPNTWAAAAEADWAALERDLRHFGDAYQPRHDREADYLRAHLQ